MLSRSYSLTFLLSHDKHFINRRPVHIKYLKFKIPPTYFLGLLGNMSELLHDQSTHSIHFVIFDIIFHAEASEKIRQRVQTIDQPGMIIALLKQVFFAIEF